VKRGKKGPGEGKGGDGNWRVKGKET